MFELYHISNAVCKKKPPPLLCNFYNHGTLVEQLEQQKVKGAVVHSPVHKFGIGSALGMRCWDAGGA